MPESEKKDAAYLLILPRTERNRILAEAAEAAAPEYEADLTLPVGERELTAFAALDGEPFLEDEIEEIHIEEIRVGWYSQPCVNTEYHTQRSENSMTMTIDAVYEAGLLRPLEPLKLSEGRHVKITVDAEDAAVALPPGPDPSRVAELLAEIAALPMEPGGKIFDGTDHDRILYGGLEGAL